MFIGEYEHNLDGKNRLNIPAKFREVVESEGGLNGFFITRGLDTCLFLYTPVQWEEVKAALRAKLFTDKASRMFKRHFFSNAAYVDIDKQGRVLIPEKLKGIAGLTKAVTIVGLDERIEVWDRERWSTMAEATSGDYEIAAQELF